MHIEKLKIVGLHGYIDKEIDFKSDITMLVGINGSGKTSILNILNWLIKPSLPNLCVTEFKSINLIFSYKKITNNILCKHNRATFKYEISIDKEKYFPLSIPIKVRPCDIGNDTNLRENLIQGYIHLSPEPKEKKTWDLISNFPNPTIIGLDRNLYTEESSDRIYYEELRSNKIARKNSNISPLERVKEIVNREYRRRKNEVLILTNKLKNHLILSTFSGSITIESFTSGIKYKLNLTQIENAETRVNDYFKNFRLDRKSTRLNSSHVRISYAVFCLKKKKK